MFQFFKGLVPKWDRQFWKSDVLAGFTLAAIGIPEVMGYTKIIGTPVITGLYTMVLPMVVFGILGSSRHLVVAADSATAALIAAALAPLALSQDAHYLELTSFVALLAGGILLLARIFRLGFLANFLSRTVLVGFLTGVGIQVAYGQLQGMLGREAGRAFHGPSFTISLTVLLIVVGLAKFAPRFPGALVAVVAMIGASAYFEFVALGVRVVGDVPAGLPALTVPHLKLLEMRDLVYVSLSCFIVILAQSAATSRAYALRYRESFDENRDLIGLGAANIAAALTGTFVVNGSPTKSAIVDSAGGRTQWAQLSSAAVVVLVLLFLTKPLGFLPEPVLATIVFVIGLKLIDLEGLASIFYASKREFGLAGLTAVTVVGLGVEQGILLAMALSLFFHVRRSYNPQSAVLVRAEDGHWQPVPTISARQALPGLLVYWFGADLFYANVGRFVEDIDGLMTRAAPKLRWLVLDAGAVTGVDYSAAKGLAELHERMRAGGITLVWAHTNPRLLHDLRRLGLLDTSLCFETLRDCVNAFEGRPDENRTR